MTLSNQSITAKWSDLLEHSDFTRIDSDIKRATTAVVLENTREALASEGGFSSMTSLLETHTNAAGTGGYGGSATAAGPVAGYDPILFTLIRRAMPNLIAYDIVGVQAMTGPTGLVFAMRSRYASQTGAEAFYGEADTGFSGVGTHANTIPNTITTGTGANTATGEAWGSIPGTNDIAEMAFSIEKVVVEAKERALKAEFTTEMATDLKKVHNLDAEAELAKILSGEIISEINREVVRSIWNSGVVGAAETAVAGVFDLDVDANGRWSVEKFKGLMFQIDREANEIAKATRRGKGNIVICSADVASALQMAGVLDHAPALSGNNLTVDDTGRTFAGVLNKTYRVYIDPYAGGQYVVVGYKGESQFDAGIVYCPYVPMQMVRATNPNSFQPKIAFKTRYGLVANPFSNGATRSDGSIVANSNVYYRKFRVANLM